MRILIILQLFLFSFTSFSAEMFEPAENIAWRVNSFVNSPDAYQSLLKLEAEVGTNGKSEIQPWSGSYWPLYLGGVSFAYATRGGQSKSFGSNLGHFESRMDRIIRRMERRGLSESDLENLSATEKYDLYLGDTEFTLTNAVWHSLLETDRSRKGKIKDWEGLCHGWAPASAYSKRPQYLFTLPSLDGKHMIPFYPHDLKALSTLLWSNSLIQDQTIVEGIRCKTNYPQRDYGSGKVTTLRCKGVNPGVFHLSILGLMGKKKLPFIINKNNDIEIWNQPARGYEFSYFNIQTGEKGPLLNSAVPVSAIHDSFNKFRAKEVAYLVGVDMTLEYLDESEPDHAETDSPKKDLIKKMHLHYDLELDAAYQVLGGEWVKGFGYHDANSRAIPEFPGFMWRFKEDVPYASSVVDTFTPNPGSAEYTSPKMVALSRMAARFRYTRYAMNEDEELDKPVLDEKGKPVESHKELRPQPIAKVVNYLLDLANDPKNMPSPTPSRRGDDDDDS